MRRQVFVPVRTDVTTTWTDVPDVFRYRPERGWRWLQRIACWVLRRLKCFHSQMQESVTTIRLDDGPAFDEVRRQMRELERTTGRDPSLIVMGAKEFREIAQMQPPRAPMLLPTETLLGVPLQVLPWLDGIAVLPWQPRLERHPMRRSPPRAAP